MVCSVLCSVCGVLCCAMSSPPSFLPPSPSCCAVLCAFFPFPLPSFCGMPCYGLSYPPSPLLYYAMLSMCRVGVQGPEADRGVHDLQLLPPGHRPGTSLSFYPSIYLPIHLSIYLPIYLIFLSFFLPLHRSGAFGNNSSMLSCVCPLAAVVYSH